MVIIFLMIILIILFAIWSIFIFYKMAAMALVNVVVGGSIVLRIIHDFRENKKNIAMYLISLSISTVLILFRKTIGLDIISSILSRTLILEAVQMLVLVFLIAQLLMAVNKKIKKQ